MFLIILSNSVKRIEECYASTALSLIVCAHWAVEEEPRNLDSACEGEPKRIRSGIWGLVILNEAPIVAFLFIPVRALVSHKHMIPFVAFLMLQFQRFHCLRV